MNLLDLMVKIGVKDEASAKVGQIGNSIKGGLASAAKAGVVALGTMAAAAASGAAAIGKTSLDAYASFEQLEGGAKLMFEDAFSFIEQRSAEAFKNVQMSQNDYLQQVNGFATGLKTALNGNAQAAAELADRIVTAEADVVAATGNTQEAVQNAFNGIMKSNFTMLDNLQIGITPTKEGFQEVIDKVNEWNAANGKTTDYMIDNLADCQSALVDYIEMVGMSGYATREAAGTIEGSVAMAKGAWTNWLAGLGKDEADLEKLTEDLIDSVATAATNIVPRLGKIMTSAASAIAGKMPELVSRAKEGIASGGPELLAAAGQLFSAILQALVDISPSIIDGMGQAMQQLVGFVMAHGQEFTGAAVNLLIAFIAGIAKMTPSIIQAALLLIANLVVSICYKVGDFVNAAVTLFNGFVSGVVSKAGSVTNAARTAIQGAIDYITSLPGRAIGWGADIINSIASGIMQGIGAVAGAASNIASTISSFLHFSEPDVGPLSNFHTFMPDMIDLMVDGIEGNRKKLAASVSNVAGDLANGLTAESSSYGIATAHNGSDGVIARLDALIRAVEKQETSIVWDDREAARMVRKYAVA